MFKEDDDNLLKNCIYCGELTKHRYINDVDSRGIPVCEKQYCSQEIAIDRWRLLDKLDPGRIKKGNNNHEKSKQERS